MKNAHRAGGTLKSSNRTDGAVDPVLTLILRLVATLLLIVVASVICAAILGRFSITATAVRHPAAPRHAPQLSADSWPRSPGATRAVTTPLRR